MMLLRRIVLFAQGLRGSRGFGVHSPFAFEFVLNVLRDRHPFYAYTRLERLHRGSSDSVKPPLWLMKLFFRVSSRLDIHDIRLIGEVDRLLVSALLMPSEKMSVNEKSGRNLLVIDKSASLSDDEILKEIMSTVAGCGSVIMMGHRPLIGTLSRCLDHGLVLTNGHSLTVIVGHRHLPVQQYIVRFT